MPKLADKSIRISFRAVVVTNVKEFPEELYGVTKHKISREKLPRFSLEVLQSAISAQDSLSYHSFALSWYLKLLIKVPLRRSIWPWAYG